MGRRNIQVNIVDDMFGELDKLDKIIKYKSEQGIAISRRDFFLMMDQETLDALMRANVSVHDKQNLSHDNNGNIPAFYVQGYDARVICKSGIGFIIGTIL